MTREIQGTVGAEEVLAKRVIGLAMKVHRALGHGFLESVYANALVIEFRNCGIIFQREKKYSVAYEGIEIGSFSADLVVENSLILELKAVECLAVAHSVQLVNYLAVSKLENGLLLNFGSKSLEFRTKTRIYGSTWEGPNLQS